MFPYNWVSYILILSRKFPWNMLFLSIFVLAYSVVISFATLMYDADSIMQAAVLTFILSAVLMLFACQTRYDFTGWGPYLLVASIGLLIFGIFAIIFPNKVMIFLYSLIGAILVSFVMYIITFSI
ncbi:Protein lifeguard 1 [Thelohanellus kitauei]|uniref:Protein lifeguard 1 n=1 Tax=Thelohanellus kitauei TaxID=669202 RepID=A0A0C2JLM2_THEKT|nr:Protein lifeguard 1 [Thelohanellus kitauei]